MSAEREVIAAAEAVIKPHSELATLEYGMRRMLAESLTGILGPLTKAVFQLADRIEALERRSQQ